MGFSGCRSTFVASLVVGLTLAASGAAQTAEPPAAPPQFAIPGSAESASTAQKERQTSPKKTKHRTRGARSADSKPRPDAAVATFPGFRLLSEGRTRVYVELSKPVSVEEHRAAGTLTYTLRGAQVLVRNNKNALITTHFSTPVARARLVPAGSDLNLVIELRKSVSATHQVVAGDNGSARLEIDFPAGDYPLASGFFEPPPGAVYRSGQELRENCAEREIITNTYVPPPPSRAPAPAPSPSPPASDKPSMGPNP